MSIQFRPLGVGGKVAGPGSYALLDDEGRYELRTVDHDWPGAVPGKHAVTLVEIAATSVADGQLPDVDPRIPPAFRNGSVTIEIPDTGLKNADFDLRKK